MYIVCTDHDPVPPGLSPGNGAAGQPGQVSHMMRWGRGGGGALWGYSIVLLYIAASVAINST